MATEYPYLCRCSRGEAVRTKEEGLWELSFRENVCCARAIEKAIREQCVPNKPALLPEGCAAPILKEYGFKRTCFVLANSLKELEEVPALREMISEEARAWAKQQRVASDPTYGRYYMVDTAIVLMNQFVKQVQDAYHALGLFEHEHCAVDMYDGNVEGKVLVMSPDTLQEEFWTPENQLWLANGGFGCDPRASGRAIHSTCLGDGETVYWNREDFIGVLDETHLPDWAKEKLEALRTAQQNQNAAQMTGGMEMG